MMPARIQELFDQVASGEPARWEIGALRAALSPLSFLYGLGAALHHWPYDLGWRRTKRLPVPVIGVGSLSVGGAGKTPMVMAIAEALDRLGIPAGIISRGYGGSADQPVTWVSRGEGPLLSAAEAGDETVMMAQGLSAPVAAGPDRWLVGRSMIAEMGPRVLVGDDLFQHRRLHRDLNLAVLDAARPREGGRLLPRGRLREPLSALRRAQAVVLTRADDPGEVERARIWLREFWGPGPVLACRHRITGLEPPSSGKGPYPDKFLAFCGLARPAQFARSLTEAGVEVVDLVAFGDHHVYTLGEMADLAARARELGAGGLVTTAKDRVRIPGPYPGGPQLFTTRLSLQFQGEQEVLERLLLWSLRNWSKKPA